jgi:hypothetical protein
MAVRPRLRAVAIVDGVDPEVVVHVAEVAERTERARAGARAALRPDARGLSRTVVAVPIGGRARRDRNGQGSRRCGDPDFGSRTARALRGGTGLAALGPFRQAWTAVSTVADTSVSTTDS